MTLFRFFAPGLMLGLLLGAFAATAQAQVTRLPTDARVTPGALHRPSVISTFDGHLVNWTFVNRIAPEPVVSYNVIATPDGNLLQLTVLRRQAMVSYILAEPVPATGKGALASALRSTWAGYPVLARIRGEMRIDLSGEDWPFFGEAGQWVETTFTLFDPNSRPTRKAELTHRVSLPVSSEGQRHETIIADGEGNVIDTSSGIDISSSLGTAGSAGAVAFCQDYANGVARSAAPGNTQLFDDMTDFVADELGPLVVGAIGGVVGAGLSDNPYGAAIGAGAGAQLSQETLPYAVDALQFAVEEYVFLAAYIGANIGCHDRLGSLDASWTLPPDVISDNPRFELEKPPAGAVLVMVCLEWSQEWEEFIQTGASEYEVILHTSKCIRMAPTWQIIF
ncbi:hypothetical protein [Jannaschia pohangensis]|uniref:Uncharacterized protein n=1 Tax=Jannaschia pohangensis TaxID=390807 RepID=A0A1I3JIG0_9RHOB|nr:hypothetical protein [Jannaschia pohangensis]SFI60037.1 hypothetical protein SAMN04488095_1335 [Jannaschia pohangensis]